MKSTIMACVGNVCQGTSWAVLNTWDGKIDIGPNGQGYLAATPLTPFLSSPSGAAFGDPAIVGTESSGSSRQWGFYYYPMAIQSSNLFIVGYDPIADNPVSSYDYTFSYTDPFGNPKTFTNKIPLYANPGSYPGGSFKNLPNPAFAALGPNLVSPGFWSTTLLLPIIGYLPGNEIGASVSAVIGSVGLQFPLGISPVRPFLQSRTDPFPNNGLLPITFVDANGKDWSVLNNDLEDVETNLSHVLLDSTFKAPMFMTAQKDQVAARALAVASDRFVCAWSAYSTAQSNALLGPPPPYPAVSPYPAEPAWGDDLCLESSRFAGMFAVFGYPGTPSPCTFLKSPATFGL